MALSKILENSIANGVVAASKLKDFTAAVDLNGVELILDADQDTSITADTDDQIDIKISGADDFRFTANTFTALSGSTIAAQALTATTIAVSNDGTIGSAGDADSMAISSSGVVTFSQPPVITEIDSGSTITLDATTDIVLDAGGADIIFKDDGTSILTMTNSSTDFIMTVATQDKDFIIKGDDGGSAITPFTLDMSAGGDLFLTGGLIDLKNDGSAVSNIKFYCESSNAHAQTLIGAPHSEGADNVLTLPGTGGDARLVSTASTATLTNKTLTSPKINEDVAVTATATEINLIDGGATVGTTAIADGDGLIINDAGTMRVSTVQTLAAYLDDEITAMPNLVSTGALNVGSITSGFTSIDVGAGAITTTGTGTIGNLVVDDVAVRW